MKRGEHSSCTTLPRKTTVPPQARTSRKTASNDTRCPKHIQASRLQLRSTAVLIQVKSPLLIRPPASDAFKIVFVNLRAR